MASRFETEVKRFSGSDTTVGTDLTDILEVVLGNEAYTHLMFEVLNGATTLTDFALLAKIHEDGEYVTLLNSTGWDTVAGILKHVVGTIKTLTNATRGMAFVEIGPVYSIKFQASVASSTSVVAIKGGLYR